MLEFIQAYGSKIYDELVFFIKHIYYRQLRIITIFDFACGVHAVHCYFNFLVY